MTTCRGSLDMCNGCPECTPGYKSLNTPEPPPTPNPNPTEPAVWDLVMADMLSRDQMGARKYGQRLVAGDGRDSLINLYQELLDAVVYIRKEIREREVRKQNNQH